MSAYKKAFNQTDNAIAKSRARAKAYYDNNREQCAAIARAYRKSNPGRTTAATKAWRQSNPEKTLFYNQRRRASKLNTGVFTITPKEIARLYSAPCAYCGEPSQHLDHVIPLSRGGRHSIGNLVGACVKCNLSKSAKFITEWKKL